MDRLSLLIGHYKNGGGRGGVVLEARLYLIGFESPGIT